MRKEEVSTTETEVLSMCDGCRLIPVSHLGLDITEPVRGFAYMLAANGIEVVEDDIGRPSISRDDLGWLLAERREREARRAAEAEERRAQAKPNVVLAGVPAQEGATPFEAMMAAESNYVTPDREFGRPGAGTATQELLEQQFAEGRRRDAERKAKARKKKQAKS
ncbi:MAG: hypothetical protein ACLFWH_05280 [Actinomycetota bacterium]